ncbi:DUF4139 domain-containing protein [candidate division WOR-3 bacterium]|nr:DUF4139 domain-containing protein [candidate division WOR-3 bacterium]
MVALLTALIGLSVSSHVERVVVYPNHVLVTRTASVTVSGPGEMTLGGLPGGLDDNTVRIKAPGLRIGEVRVRRGYLAEPTPEVRRLEERVRQLEDTVAALDGEAAVLKAREDFLVSVKLGAPELIARELQQGRVAPDAWRGALSFVADELMRVKERAIGLGRRREVKARELEAARQEHAAARSAVEDRKEIAFDCAGDAGDYQLEVAYVIGGAARWEPYYELRASPADGRVEVTYFAKLVQRTGEDWERVSVVLSTATPATGVTAPQPQPWYLTLVEEYRAAKRATLEAFAAEAMPAPGAASRDGVMEEADQLQVVETGIALQYVVPGRVSVVSGEPAKKLELARTGLAAEFDYYALPRASQQAFLTGRLVNTGDMVLLAGAGNTYVGEEYTGSTWLSTTAPQESTELSFGVDERVKITRELVRSFRSRAGLFSRNERAQFVYRTTVENYHPRTIAIRVVEQVPVSQQGDIRVSVSRVEPQFLEQDENAGTYTWKPELQPRQRLSIDVEFTVEYPSGRRVNGLY